MVIFDDVDISIIVEKEINGEKVPLPLVIRKVNEKTFHGIHREIKQAKEQAVENEKDYVLGDNQFQWAHEILCCITLILENRNLEEFYFKKSLVNEKNVRNCCGNFGRNDGKSERLGSIVKKPGVVKEQIEIREYLYMTILIDHDVIDGAPAARFVSRLSELVESGYGL